jgi:hypothetical protein
MFSSINRRLEIRRTRTIKFLNPRKLGAASLSWLRHDVRGFECTAATCLYFFLVYFRNESALCCCVSGFGKSAMLIFALGLPFVPFACESPVPVRLIVEEASGAETTPVTVAFSVVAILKTTCSSDCMLDELVSKSRGKG